MSPVTILLTRLPRALMILTILTIPISKTLRTAALSLGNRDIERSEAGSMQSPPEAFSMTHRGFPLCLPLREGLTFL
jgi:hypothetical protein